MARGKRENVNRLKKKIVTAQNTEGKGTRDDCPNQINNSLNIHSTLRRKGRVFSPQGKDKRSSATSAFP